MPTVPQKAVVEGLRAQIEGFRRQLAESAEFLGGAIDAAAMEAATVALLAELDAVIAEPSS